MATYPNVNAANQYARDIVGGKILACQLTILACQRHLDDLERAKDPHWPYRFDKNKAERFLRFAQKMPHTSGEWARRKLRIEFEAWQKFALGVPFGWVLRKTEENIKRVSDAKTLAQLGLSGKITSLTDDLKGALSTPPKETGEGNPWGGDGGTGTGKGSKSKVDQFKTLRQQIEEAHASSLARINLQEKDSNRELQEAAKKNGASDADLQRALLMNAENYQKQRLDLAAQYSPARETLRKEQEASRDLAELFKARLLDEKEYQAARITLARDTAKELLQAHADEIAAPALDNVDGY